MANTMTAKALMAKSTKFVSEVVRITPAMAKEILPSRAKNRTLTANTYGPLLADMLNGRWAFNGQPISFDSEGKLIDGQHRLSALSEAGDYGKCLDGFDFLVLRGLPSEAMDTTDIGRKRSFADQVNIRIGDDTTKPGTAVASTLRALYLLGQAGVGGKLGGGKLTAAQLQHLWAQNPKVTDSIALCFAKKENGKAISPRPATVAALHYAVHHLVKGKKDDVKALKASVDAFVETLKTGVPDERAKADPALLLDQNSGGHTENDTLRAVANAFAFYRLDGNADGTGPLGELTAVKLRSDSYGKTMTIRPLANAGEAEGVVNPSIVNGGPFEDIAALRKVAAEAVAAKEAAASAGTKEALTSGPAAAPVARKGASKAAVAKARKASGKEASANAHAAVPPKKVTAEGALPDHLQKALDEAKATGLTD